MMRHQVKSLFSGWEGDRPYWNEQHLSMHTLQLHIFSASKIDVTLGAPPVNVT